MRINKELLEKPWTARWIFDPEGPVCDFGVFHFRKKLHFRKVPRSFVIHVSADNRYYLLVNGKSVSRGPCRGDLNRWFFETVDIAPFLHAGENVIAAIVWNFGIHRPLAQITFQTRFLLQGNSKKERIADTRTLNGWKSFYNKGYAPYLEGMETSFIAVGPGEKVDGKLYPWGWEKEGFDDTGWSEVKESLPRALPREDRTWGSVSYLVPRPIPLMVKERGFFNKAVLSDGIEVPDGFICGREEMEIPAESRVSLILDNGVLTTAYPEMEVSGGKGSSVIVCYAESLNKSGEKGNRNEIEGKTINGLSDCFMPDGGEGRVFNSLWWRAFRYVQVKIATGREPLRIKKFSFLYTGYPFIEKGSFKSNDAELKKI